MTDTYNEASPDQIGRGSLTGTGDGATDSEYRTYATNKHDGENPESKGDAGSGESGAGISVPLVTKFRNRRFRGRTTIFLTLPPAILLASVLSAMTEIDRSVRVLVVGPWPFRGIEGARAWSGGELPEGFAVGAKGHYLDGHHPTFRYTFGGHGIELSAAAQWFGEGDYSEADCAAVWSWLNGELSARFDGGTLLSTPAATGRDLFLRSLGSREFPVLDEETQQLIRSTSGQGRVETYVSESGSDRLERFIEYDARMAYAGCVRELGHGVPVRDTVPHFQPHARGRYKVRFTVPFGWRHVGCLPVATEDGETWSYPSAPGTVWTTWADGAELYNAGRQGWRFDVLERLIFPEHRGRPLDGWADKLLAVLDAFDQGPSRFAVRDKMVRAAVRGMILHSIGAFHGRTHKVSRSGPAEAVPAGAKGVTLDMSSGLMQWTEQSGQAWPELAHPEWSAAIWARARTRLLTSPGSTGMLHVPRADLIGCRVDAIYMSADPGWLDDGKVGRYRKVLDVTGEWSRPANGGDLLRLKERLSGGF